VYTQSTVDGRGEAYTDCTQEQVLGQGVWGRTSCSGGVRLEWGGIYRLYPGAGPWTGGVGEDFMLRRG
jgi:hypothetical protein